MTLMGWIALAGWAGVAILLLFWKSFIPAYLNKKGENLATHEDLNKLVEQMKAVTEATKEIEANISDKVWNKQRHWEMKREGVLTVMQALGKADEALHSVSNALKVAHKSEQPEIFQTAITERWEKCYYDIEDFDRKRALALIVCDKSFNDTLMAIGQQLRAIAYELGEGKLGAYAEISKELSHNYAQAYGFARRELGIHREKAESMPISGESSPLK